MSLDQAKALGDGALEQLFRAILTLKSEDDCRKFFEDLCTPGELQAMADRWKAAQLLKQEVPYRRIYEQTGVSTATVTRVARSLTHGAGGYQLAMARLGIHAELAKEER